MVRFAFFRGARLRRVVVSGIGGLALTCFAAASYATGLTISGSPGTAATVGYAYSFTPASTHPSGTTPTFHISNRPAWASFNASTGALSGTPPASAANTTQGDILIYVSDSGANAFLPQFAIRVYPAPAGGGGGGGGSGGGSGPLTISGSPGTAATVGYGYSFTPGGTHPSGTTPTFHISNRPAWASFNASTGTLSGTPPSSAAGTTQGDILIYVSDNGANAFLPQFAIRVYAASSAPPDLPVLSGSPATSATVGKAYAFQPTAKDPAGKTLSFSVQNKPSWASFSIATGLLNGTPSSSQTGTYSNIIIAASNGSYTTALPGFNIAVSAAGSPPPPGAAQLTWVPPTQNTNGTALTDLAGVRIYYGSSPSSLSKSVQVAGSSATTYTISGLTAGTWYFGAEAYTTTGVSSAMSSVVSKAVQ